MSSSAFVQVVSLGSHTLSSCSNTLLLGIRAPTAPPSTVTRRSRRNVPTLPNVVASAATVKSPRKRRRRSSSQYDTVSSKVSTVSVSSEAGTSTIDVPPNLSPPAPSISGETSFGPSVETMPIDDDILADSSSLAIPSLSPPTTTTLDEDCTRNLRFSLPHELPSHSLLSLSDQLRLLDDIKFLQDIEAAIQTVTSDTSIASYLHMSEQDLAIQRHAALQARNALVASNIRLVITIAANVHRSVCRRGTKTTGRNRKIHHNSGFGYQPAASTTETSGVTISDLVSEGAIALIRAAERYDPSRGVRFITYAARAIQSACYRAAVPASCIVSIPDRLRRAVRRANKTSSQAYSLPYPGHEQEVTNNEHVPDHLVELARLHLSSGVSLDEPVALSSFSSPSSRGVNNDGTGNNRQTTTRNDLLVCSRSQPQVHVEQEIRRDEIRTFCYQILPQQQADVVILRFGLHGLPPMPPKDVARAYGVTPSWINQILAKARITLGKAWPFFEDYLQYQRMEDGPS